MLEVPTVARIDYTKMIPADELDLMLQRKVSPSSKVPANLIGGGEGDSFPRPNLTIILTLDM